MAVLITYNETLAFGGTFDPAFILKIVRSHSTLKSFLQLILLQDCLDRINPTLNEDYSHQFSKFIEENLNIPKDRGYIAFSDPGRAYLGYVKFQSGSFS
jgi:phenylpyruvate tautomerase